MTFIVLSGPRRALRFPARRAAQWSAIASAVASFVIPQARAQSGGLDFSRFLPQPVVSASGGTAASAVPGGASPGLYVEVLGGAIVVSNGGGSPLFSAGQFGFTPNFSVPPVVLPQNPGILFTPPPIFSATGSPTQPTPATGPVVLLPTPRPPAAELPPVLTPPVVTPPVLPPPVVLTSGAGYYMMNWGSDGIASLGTGTATFNAASEMTKFVGSDMPFNVVSAVTVADAGKLDDLGWGRWTAGTISDHGETIDLSTWSSGMPYIVGRPTLDANLPISGTMTYALAGATKAIDRISGATGTLTGSLSIAFQNARYDVTPNLNIAMPGQTYSTGAGMTVVGPDGARATFDTMTQNVSGGACVGGACTFSTQGVLTGAAANNAGIVYSLSGPEIRVTGAAGFKR